MFDTITKDEAESKTTFSAKLDFDKTWHRWVAHEREGKSYNEIARVEGVSPQTIHHSVANFTKKLVNAFGGDSK